jgi:probable rRNA maturation factor
MPVHMQSQVRCVRFDQARLDRLARAILSDVGEASAELGILFVGDQRMRGLNRRYRGKDRTTDVLAFAMREAPDSSAGLLGDVVIAVPTAARQAKQGQRSLDEELTVLLIHGILHLCGYDHERSEKEARRMHRRERMILRSLARLPKRAGCGKTMLARETFDGEHVCTTGVHSRRIAARDMRDWRDE